MTAPESYVQWINEHLGFNPRGQKNSDALSDFVVSDLKAGCPALERAFQAGRLLPRKNVNVKTKVVERNVDLVIQDTEGHPDVILPGPVVAFSIAVEHKTIMTAHEKARKNRYGDIVAYSNHMHNHWRDCIAAAIVIINTSLAYENPDTFAKGLVRPQFKMDKIVKATIDIFAKVPLRESPEDPSDQPEALAVIVVDYDGTNPAVLVTDERAPQVGQPHHYDSFISRICGLYERRLLK
ncbi:MAG TPA: hypothetical protein VJX67_00160 [Blastocatellia bacterium]|nr:hypothetical protein [Blastocatellia bacterium]